MDKAFLEAIIRAKGKKLGFDDEMLNEMLGTQSTTGYEDKLDISGKEYGLTKDALDIQKKQFDFSTAKEDRTTKKEANALDLQLKKLNLESKQKELDKSGGLTADEKKKQDKLGTLSTNLKVLEKNLNQVEQRGVLGGGVGKILAGVTGGAQFGETADYEALRKGLIGPVARAISGEVGVLTDRDISRAEQLLPKVTDDPALAERKLQNLNQLISEQGGGTFRKQGDVKKTGKSNTGNVLTDAVKNNPLSDFLLGGATNVAQDIGTGLRGAQSQSNFQKSEENAKRLEQAAMSTNDMQERKILLQQANSLRQGISGEASDISSSFSPDVQDNPLIRALGASTQIAAAAEIPALAGGLSKGVKTLLHPFKTVGELRKVAVEEASKKTISGNSIIDDIVKKAKTISPTEKRSYENFIDSAKGMLKDKKISIKEALELKEEANKAFTAAGKVGKSAKATFNKAMGDSIRTQMKNVAPNVSKADKVFSRMFGVKDTVRKYGGQAAVGAGAAGVTYYLLNKLGLGRGY